VIEVLAETQGRVDRVLAAQLDGVSRSEVGRWIEEGRVSIAGTLVRPSTLVSVGQTIAVDPPSARPPQELTPADVPLSIAYEDADVIVVNKPRGLATHPAPTLNEPTLVHALLHHGARLSQGTAAYRPGIVHRLDKATTGLILVAKNDVAHRALAQQIANRTLKRRYLAIVGGDVSRLAPEGTFTVSAPIGRDPRNRQRMAVDPKGKPATTHVRVLKRVDAGTLVQCDLETGRTHQIRVHLRSLGLPVVGDPIYAPKEFQTAALQLHAWKLMFLQPTSGERVDVEALPPKDFLAQP
jgi:23S rRNA pseudouridine1911/1915/1917 synthase